MDLRKNEAAKRDAQSQEEPAKKPYEMPQVIYRAPLEAMANVCTRTFANPTACPGTGKGDASCAALNS